MSLKSCFHDYIIIWENAISILYEKISLQNSHLCRKNAPEYKGWLSLGGVFCIFQIFFREHVLIL